MERRPGSWRIARVGGVPVFVSTMWPFMVLVLAWLYGTSIAAAGAPTALAAAWGIWLVVVLMLSVVIHEGSHALAGRAAGFDVQSVSLTAWGGHTDFADWRPRPWSTALVAVAGPIANLALAGIAWLVQNAVPGSDLIYVGTQSVIWVNLILGLFNLLPGLPMDGGRVVEAIAWAATKNRSRSQRIAGLAGMVVAAGIFVYAFRGLPRGASADLWLAFIAVFLFLGARQAYAQAPARARLDAVTVAQASLPGLLLPATATVGDVAAATGGQRVAVLTDEPDLVGVVPSVSPDANPAAPARELALPCRARPVDVTPDTPVADLVAAMATTGQEIVVGRYPDGEPRVITGALVVNAVKREAQQPRD